MKEIKRSSELPYYAVIFTSLRIDIDEGYRETSERMLELVKMQEGFIGVESAREELGITVSYWKDLESIHKWKENMEHSLARERGRMEWYRAFHVRIARVEHEYDFER